MRAAQITAFGGPEVLRETEVPAPEPLAGQIVMAVETAGVNFAEVLMRQGKMPGLRPPVVPGLEAAGRVAAVGEGVRGFTPGAPVAAFTFSGYAQFAAVDARLAVPLGDFPDTAFAATVPCAAVSGYLMLDHLARLRQGETVLIHGAAGGVGGLAAQIARALGAERVLGTVGRPGKAEYAAGLGYDEVFDRQDFTSAVADLTKGRGVDVVLEMLGGEHVTRSLDALAPGGRVVYFGDPDFASQATVPVQRLRSANHGVLGFSLGGLAWQSPGLWRPAAESVLRLAREGRLQSTVTGAYPLSEASAAHALLESGRSVGKLVLQIPPA
ncbi:NADPH2:quinone reductase [Thermocatellispora tengchongensis]|uniref:NADPH2:quinone reductase n=1 Tax=Thermocatellispora tengchongensis TaxID=1073253 RepID=A0A840PFD8_9ACTN|nr:zinc-binding dehydrogenase [Thermocatellispora tengchongensis]MBB5137882.1 NADPH2:quinone reductase [Thermocatellispora tengchongensis]